MTESVTVGLVQTSPVFLNLAESLEKAIEQIAEAARLGAQVVVFGETWLAGYPAWLDNCSDAALWNYEPTKQVFARMRQNSLVVPSRDTERLAHAARKNNVTVVIGANERVASGVGNGTLYNSLLIFSEEGKLVNHHRKLVPTFTERLVHGQGDGDGLKAVDTTTGARIGGLICWEHWMPLARQAMHNSGEHIHVAVFPTVHEMHQIAVRHYAFEGRCFVLAVGLVMKASELPSELKVAEHLNLTAESYILRGGSCVINPDGQFLVEPVFDSSEIIIAKLEMAKIDAEKMTLDVSGHYQRLDVFDFKTRTNSRSELNN